MNRSQILLKGLDLPLEQFKELKSGEIRNLILDLGKACNYKCMYCATSEHKGVSKDNLTLDERKKVIRDAAGNGAKAVFFAGEGEPVLDKDFKKLVMFNSKLGVTTILYSNISLLNKEMVEFLYNHDVTLVIKIDSLRRDTYNLLVGKEAYDLFRKGLDLIIETYGAQTSNNDLGFSRVQVSMVLNKFNENEVEDISSFCEKHGYIFCCKTPGKKGNAKNNWELLIGNEELRLQGLAKAYSQKEQTTANIEGKCSIASYGLAVTRIGDVALCETARLDNAIGNVRRTPLKELAEKKQNIFNSYGCPACIAKYLHNGKHATSMLAS